MVTAGNGCRRLERTIPERREICLRPADDDERNLR
jgi:hypothetical protein